MGGGRSDKSFKAIFKAAGLVVLRQELQKGFPGGQFLLSVDVKSIKRTVVDT